MSTIDKFLEELITFLGVGALHVLGIFLILDGIFNIYFLIDIYVQTSIWVVYVTIPALFIIAYFLGVLSMLLSELIVSRVFKKGDFSKNLFATITKFDNQMLSTRYESMERIRKLLNSCMLALPILAMGSVSEAHNLGESSAAGYIGAVGAIFIAICCPLLAIKIEKDLMALYIIVKQHKKKKNK